MKREPSEYLVARIHQALAEDPRVNEMSVIATISGTKIFLHGVVASEERRAAIGVVVAEACPGYDVRNETSVEDLAADVTAEPLS